MTLLGRLRERLLALTTDALWDTSGGGRPLVPLRMGRSRVRHSTMNEFIGWLAILLPVVLVSVLLIYLLSRMRKMRVRTQRWDHATLLDRRRRISKNECKWLSCTFSSES